MARLSQLSQEEAALMDSCPILEVTGPDEDGGTGTSVSHGT